MNNNKHTHYLVYTCGKSSHELLLYSATDGPNCGPRSRLRRNGKNTRGQSTVVVVSYAKSDKDNDDLETCDE